MRKGLAVTIIAILVVGLGISLGGIVYYRAQFSKISPTKGKLEDKALEQILKSITIKGTKEELSYEKIIEDKKDFIRKLINESSPITAYYAFLANDISQCQSARTPIRCEGTFQVIKLLKNFAQKNCDQIPDEFSDLISACQTNSCESLSEGVNKHLCNAILNKDMEECRIGLEKAGAKPEEIKLKCESYFVLYEGFKTKNPAICNNLSEENRIGKLLCESLIGKKDIDKYLDALVPDIGYFALARELENQELCKNIKNEFVKSCCSNSEVDINALFTKLFYPSLK